MIVIFSAFMGNDKSREPRSGSRKICPCHIQVHFLGTQKNKTRIPYIYNIFQQFCPKQKNLELFSFAALLIFFVRLKVQQSNLSANAPTNMDADNIFDFSRFLYRIWIFCPKIANFWPIQIWTIQPMFSVMLWSTTVQTFVPIHQQI